MNIRHEIDAGGDVIFYSKDSFSENIYPVTVWNPLCSMDQIPKIKT